MRKYEPLGEYLADLSSNSVELTTSEIEHIIHSSLPRSAREYREWWANDKTHSQAKDGWLSVGWKVDGVNPSYTRIRFVKVR